MTDKQSTAKSALRQPRTTVHRPLAVSGSKTIIPAVKPSVRNALTSIPPIAAGGKVSGIVKSVVAGNTCGMPSNPGPSTSVLSSAPMKSVKRLATPAPVSRTQHSTPLQKPTISVRGRLAPPQTGSPASKSGNVISNKDVAKQAVAAIRVPGIVNHSTYIAAESVIIAPRCEEQSCSLQSREAVEREKAERLEKLLAKKETSSARAQRRVDKLLKELRAKHEEAKHSHEQSKAEKDEESWKVVAEQRQQNIEKMPKQLADGKVLLECTKTLEAELEKQIAKNQLLEASTKEAAFRKY